MTMIVTVKFFAATRELVGSEETKLELPDVATIADAKRALADRYPQIAILLVRSALAKNQDYALDTDYLSPHDELAVIPPVSGG